MQVQPRDLSCLKPPRTIPAYASPNRGTDTSGYLVKTRSWCFNYPVRFITSSILTVADMLKFWTRTSFSSLPNQPALPARDMSTWSTRAYYLARSRTGALLTRLSPENVRRQIYDFTTGIPGIRAGQEEEVSDGVSNQGSLGSYYANSSSVHCCACSRRAGLSVDV